MPFRAQSLRAEYSFEETLERILERLLLGVDAFTAEVAKRLQGLLLLARKLLRRQNLDAHMLVAASRSS